MVVKEVLVKVGDSGSWKDGEPIAYADPGAVFTAAEVTAWFADPKARPKELDTLSKGEQSKWEFWYTNATDDQRAKAEKYGINTSWGFADRVEHAIVKLDLSEAEFKELVESPPPSEQVEERRTHTMKASLWTGQEKLDLLDKGKYLTKGKDHTGMAGGKEGIATKKAKYLAGGKGLDGGSGR